MPDHAGLTFCFLIDKPEDLTPRMDTSLLLASECYKRGHTVLMATRDEIYVHDDKVHVRWWRSRYRDGDDVAASLEPTDAVALHDFPHLILMRKDPPVDTSYVALVQILTRAQARIINEPSLLITANEKMLPLAGPYRVPDTYVSNNPAFIEDTVSRSGSKWVIKPTNDKGGADVFIVGPDYKETPDLIRRVTVNGTTTAIFQPFLDAVREGDKRIFLLSGEPIGWMNRVPKKDDFRANVHLGATPLPCSLTQRDRDICAWVASILPPDKVPLIALDIIGGFLTEVNITSPSGIPEINQVMNARLQTVIVDAMEIMTAEFA